MSLFKSKSAAKKEQRASADFIVVQYCPGADPEVEVGKPWDRAAAMRIFEGVLAEAPAGYYTPQTRARIRVMSVGDWNKARLAEAVPSS